MLETQINQRISELAEEAKKQKLEMRKVEFQIEQLEREKRLD
jgi:hypothetical protein